MSELIEKLKEVRNNGSKRNAHIGLANACITEVETLQRQLAEAREEYNALINKNTLLIAGNSILMQQLKEKGE